MILKSDWLINLCRSNQSYYVDRKDGRLFDINISMDDMITNVMIYWITESITASMRSVEDNFHLMNYVHYFKTSVPTAISCFKNEVFCYPKIYVNDMYPSIVQYVDNGFGGHYAAFEHPEVAGADIRSSVSKVMLK